MISPDILELEKQLVSFEQEKMHALIKAKAKFSSESSNEYLRYQHDYLYQEVKSLLPKEYQRICNQILWLSSLIVSPYQLLSVFDSYLQNSEPQIAINPAKMQEAQEVAKRYHFILSDEWEKRALFQRLEESVYQKQTDQRTISIHIGEGLNSAYMVYDGKRKSACIKYYMEINTEGKLSISNCLLVLYHKETTNHESPIYAMLSNYTLQEAVSHAIAYTTEHYSLADRKWQAI